MGEGSGVGVEGAWLEEMKGSGQILGFRAWGVASCEPRNVRVPRLFQSQDGGGGGGNLTRAKQRDRGMWGLGVCLQGPYYIYIYIYTYIYTYIYIFIYI